MNKQYLVLAALSLLTFSTLSPGDMRECSDRDWTKTAKYAEETRLPIIILYTAPGCAYCERLKDEVLKPMFGKQEQLALVREVDINSGGKMTDFDGELIRSRQFKQRYHVFATPTLLILDSAGRPLRDPIVGYDSKDQYQSRLKKVLAGFQI